MAVKGVTFLKPVEVGNVVCCSGRVVRGGTTFIALELEVWVKHVGHEGVAIVHAMRTT